MAGQKRKTPAKKAPVAEAKSAKKAGSKAAASKKKLAEETVAEDDEKVKAKRAATNAERRGRMRKAMQALGRLGEDDDSADESGDAAGDRAVDDDDRFVPLTEADQVDAGPSAEDDEDEDDEDDEDASDEDENVEDETKDSDKTEEEQPKKKQKKVASKDGSKSSTTNARGKDGAKADSRTGKLRSKEGVIYLGHIPHGFYEEQMKGFFSQFGEVVQLRLSRSKKSGLSRGYAFIQFRSNEVAKIVQQAMHNYLLCDKLLVCELVKPENVHERMFANAHRRFRKINWAKVDAMRMNKDRTEEEAENRIRKLKSRHAKQQSNRKAKGIDYELPGYA
ncbi:MKI67 FHA domain-interacting nucleolar phosphoprotein-like [Hondaea fermentalgiana]|uniref:MKI67 FHA domain-interacting nucleolar phosphoprotein-like n=1 Tax=Hondaea fermentalgiana TaxID=2315210 RepID=A0A2R5GLB4_9STRA|nr:MKI67 FHA domain-interacting nucleolar phosphoprotein-like [Hondaea fermentalgiana]|eukprot:GBG31425.1 MKI67 FHA domain-interacting nucleolar phosphoprotein-like [Hondaea fermentalgiana]